MERNLIKRWIMKNSLVNSLEKRQKLLKLAKQEVTEERKEPKKRYKGNQSTRRVCWPCASVGGRASVFIQPCLVYRGLQAFLHVFLGVKNLDVLWHWRSLRFGGTGRCFESGRCFLALGINDFLNLIEVVEWKPVFPIWLKFLWLWIRESSGTKYPWTVRDFCMLWLGH